MHINTAINSSPAKKQPWMLRLIKLSTELYEVERVFTIIRNEIVNNFWEFITRIFNSSLITINVNARGTRVLITSYPWWIAVDDCESQLIEMIRFIELWRKKFAAAVKPNIVQCHSGYSFATIRMVDLRMANVNSLMAAIPYGDLQIRDNISLVFIIFAVSAVPFAWKHGAE